MRVKSFFQVSVAVVAVGFASQTLANAQQQVTPISDLPVNRATSASSTTSVENLGKKCGYPVEGVKACRMVQRRSNSTYGHEYRARAWIRDEAGGKDWEVGVRHITLRNPAGGAGCGYPGASIEYAANPSQNGLFDYDEDDWTPWVDVSNGDIWTLVEIMGRPASGDDFNKWVTSYRHCF